MSAVIKHKHVVKAVGVCLRNVNTNLYTFPNFFTSRIVAVTLVLNTQLKRFLPNVEHCAFERRD